MGAEAEVRPARYRFADFDLDAAAFQLRRDGQSVRLEKIPFELLLLLVENAGRLVTRVQIAERLWGKDVFLDTEQGINTAIRKVRQALDDDPENARLLQTVVGKGYRFIGPVTAVRDRDESAGAAPVARAQHARAPGRGIPRRATAVLALITLAAVAWFVAGRLVARPRVQSLAVLPLENLGDRDQQFFADGITDALITRLAKLRNVRVISRTSSMHYQGVRRPLPDIARELGVDAVVEGTIARGGKRVRITAQLIDARNDRHLWADEFDRDLGDILAVQGEVADNIARAVRTTLLEAAPPAGAVDPSAYDHYLRGRSFWNQRTEDGLSRAIAEFEQAVAIAPSYAEAYSGLADAYTALGYASYRSPAETFPFARDAARRALALDPRLAEAHASLGYIALYNEWDWTAAESAFRRALAKNPNYATAHHWYSVFLTALGRHQEAAAEIGHARDLDPLSLPIATDIGFELYYAGRYEEAMAQLRKVLETNPRAPLAHLWLGRCYEARGLYPEAVREFERTAETLGDWPVTLAAAGHALGRGGRMAEARAVLARLERLGQERYVTPYGLALVFDGLGERGLAIQWLERAYAERSHWLVWLALDPRFDDLRSDPRFAALLASMHFPGSPRPVRGQKPE